MWRKENPYTLLLIIFFGAAIMDNSIAILKKIKNRNTIWTRYSTSGHFFEKYKNINSKKYRHPCVYVHSIIIYDSQDMETIWMSIDIWNKESVLYV